MSPTYWQELGRVACAALVLQAGCREEAPPSAAQRAGESGSLSAVAATPDASAEGPRELCRDDRDCPVTTRCCMSGLFGICSPLGPGECPAPDLTLALPPDFKPRLEERLFLQSDCLLQKCVSGPGPRRLLRFPVDLVNRGEGPMILALPDGPGVRQVACDGSMFLNDFLRYELLDAAGVRQARGTGDVALACSIGDLAESTSPFDCDILGIEAHSYRAFPSEADCQWVDVTTLPPGQYTLRVSVNADWRLTEENRQNNVVERSVTISAADPLAACNPDDLPEEVGYGRSVECGWEMIPGQTAINCEPGARIQRVCTFCDGAYVPRVCPGVEACSAAASLPVFGMGHIPEACTLEDACEGVGECADFAFECPATGVYSLLGFPTSPAVPIGTAPVSAPSRVTCRPSEGQPDFRPGSSATSGSDSRSGASDAGTPPP